MRDATGLVAAPTESPYRWLMLALVCFLYCTFGLVSASLAPLLTNIQDDLQVSDALTGVALAAWQFVYIFLRYRRVRRSSDWGLARGWRWRAC